MAGTCLSRLGKQFLRLSGWRSGGAGSNDESGGQEPLVVVVRVGVAELHVRVGAHGGHQQRRGDLALSVGSCLTVVGGGRRFAAIGLSSNPTIDSSSGTCMPRSCAASTTTRNDEELHGAVGGWV